MNDSEKWDRLLRQALAPEAGPEEKLNQSIVKRLKERSGMKRGYRKRISIGITAAVFALVMSITAYAATQLFSSKQVAEHLGEQVLAKAFESSDAVEIDQSIASGDYNFTLHGIVSGAGLKELGGSQEAIHPERTYAVVSIARQDGEPMPHTSDPEYGKEPFFVSPFIKGLKPWQVNIMTMNGGYSEVVVDGIMYRLIECDGVEMFADRGVYLAISSGSAFYNSDAFAYDEGTGEISVKTDYAGTSLLFELPLDKSKADPAKAEGYLQELLQEPDKTAADASDDSEEAKLAKKIEEWKKKVPDGVVIPESVKEVTYEEQGMIHYEYDGWNVTLAAELLFEEGQTGVSKAVQFSEDDFGFKALQFTKDENGVITGRILVLH